MTEADAELVARIQEGDASAFEALMRRHYRMAWIVAYAQVNNRADAEDVCQDAFVRCWERIGECRDPARVQAWIAAIVRNTAHNRRAFLNLRRSDTLESNGGLPAATRTEALAERNELRERLSAAIGRLSRVQREVVLLHDYEGWRHAEIAAQLDISAMMSRRHLSDARKLLREILGDLPTLGPDHD